MAGTPKNARSREEIAQETGSDKLELFIADLSSQKQVHRLADEVIESHERLITF
jgi:hypothetical protein